MGRVYGAGPRHLLAVLVAMAVAGSAVLELGWSALWNEEVWWQSIPVWFVGAVVLHDLVLFPAYSFVDRLLVAAARTRRSRECDSVAVPLLNHVRVPLLAIGLITLMFLPGIIGQGASSYEAATGQTQDPFLVRWLLLCAGIVAASGFVYGVRRLRARRLRPSD
jgi:hypothetical protein